MAIAKNINLNRFDKKFLNDSMKEPMLSREEEKKRENQTLHELNEEEQNDDELVEEKIGMLNRELPLGEIAVRGQENSVYANKIIKRNYRKPKTEDIVRYTTQKTRELLESRPRESKQSYEDMIEQMILEELGRNKPKKRDGRTRKKKKRVVESSSEEEEEESSEYEFSD